MVTCVANGDRIYRRVVGMLPAQHNASDSACRRPHQFEGESVLYQGDQHFFGAAQPSAAYVVPEDLVGDAPLGEY